MPPPSWPWCFPFCSLLHCHNAPQRQDVNDTPFTYIHDDSWEVFVFSSSLVDVPRPYIDPVSSAVEALGVASLVFSRPRQISTIYLVMDAQRRGLHLNRCSELTMKTLHDIVADASRVEGAHNIVLVTSRVSTPIQKGDVNLLDVGRTLFSHAGLHLLDWIVVGCGGLYFPRSLTNAPDPWSLSV